MKLNNLPSEFQEALPILKKIREAGYEAYFVGGSVRDVLLNRPIHDVDIATSSYPEETKSIFHRTVDIGIEHGTVLVLEEGGEYEITTFRTEDVYVDYRRPSSVSFVRSLEEDLKRRDFTVNAFAPGIVKTPMMYDIAHQVGQNAGKSDEWGMETFAKNIAMKRLSEPEDVANVVSFLAGPDSNYVTGQTIIVDGGMQFH